MYRHYIWTFGKREKVKKEKRIISFSDAMRTWISHAKHTFGNFTKINNNFIVPYQTRSHICDAQIESFRFVDDGSIVDSPAHTRHWTRSFIFSLNEITVFPLDLVFSCERRHNVWFGLWMSITTYQVPIHRMAVRDGLTLFMNLFKGIYTKSPTFNPQNLFTANGQRIITHVWKDWKSAIWHLCTTAFLYQMTFLKWQTFGMVDWFSFCNFSKTILQNEMNNNHWHPFFIWNSMFFFYHSRRVRYQTPSSECVSERWMNGNDEEHLKWVHSMNGFRYESVENGGVE